MNKTIKANVLVTGQFGALALLLLTAQPFHFYIPVLFLLLLSAFIAVAALSSMRHSKMRISPVPAREARLMTTGIYAYIRHPMYLAVIVFATALLSDSFSYLRLSFFIFLCIDLLVKLNWEETLLQEKFDAYRSYMNCTKRLIPYFY